MTRFKVWKCTDFEGPWPVGVAAIVVAATEYIAGGLLVLALADRGLTVAVDSFTLEEVDMTYPHAEILDDGDC
jgi:hypothetical protein